MPRDVFVSYSQPDHDCAHEVVARIEAEGIGCWIAPRDIAPAADWAAEIIDAIACARVMVLVFSSSSNDSPQVRREVERAVHKQVRILPFRLEDVLPSKSLEYFLSAQHWLDAFPPPRDPHYARLCAYLHSALGTEPRAGAAERSPDPAPALESAPAAGRFEASLLREAEAELAACIGPIARLLVQRAAASARGSEELLAKLAAELESDRDRQRFAEACARLRRPRS